MGLLTVEFRNVTHTYIVGHKKEPTYFCLILCQKLTDFSAVITLDLKMNGTCDSVNFTHLTYLMLLHYLVKVKAPQV